MQVRQMICTHPDVRGSTNAALMPCIEKCYSCAQICTSCADACLAEHNVQKLTQCIRLNLDCAASATSRGVSPLGELGLTKMLPDAC